MTGSAKQGAGKAADEEYVPETAFRKEGHQSDFHTGRGGAGNEHRDRFGGHSTKHEQDHEGESLVDKVKHLVGKK